MTQHIGILTSGGDSPGLNAAIRGVGKAAQGCYGMEVIGIRDGFRGLVENRMAHLDRAMLSGILTRGGLCGLVSYACEKLGQRAADGYLVVHDEDARAGESGLSWGIGLIGRLDHRTLSRA